jgi:Protein of unknown function VcgC/VcgE (DUF2780)
MSEIADTLSSQTGLSNDLVHKGVGALLNFIKAELGPETYAKLESVVPGAEEAIEKFESSPDSSHGGLLEMVAALAGKVLGGRAEEVAKLMESFAKIGFKPEQIEAFLPKAIELIKSYLPPEVLELVLSKIPALARFTESGTA